MNCFVKESYGVIWHFYHNSHGICYCKMNDENIREYQVLLPEGQEDFDILADDSDCLHMVFQNSDGDILYANHFNGQWRKTTLLESKSKGCYPKNFVLKRVNNWLNLLYCIEYNGRRMLTHQIIDGNESTPFVVDCIRDDFCTAQDSAGNINVFFYSETQQAWGIRRFVWSRKEWTEFTLSDGVKDCCNPFLFIDREDNVHIVYDRDNCIYEFYEGVEKMIGMGQRPIMLYQRGNIIMWEGIMDNKVYVKKENDTAPTVIMSGGFSKPVRFKIRYTTYEQDLIAECCTGNIINGSVRMYGINNFFVVADSSPVSAGLKSKGEEDNGAYLEIQKLKVGISRLNNLIEGLQSTVESYDMQKINRRLDELETAVSKTNKTKFLGFF